MVRSVTPAGKAPGPRFFALVWRLGAPTHALSSRASIIVGVSMLIPALLIFAWIAVHRISGFAPWLADSMRRVIGVEGVARLEEAVYGVEDSLNSVVRRGEKPRVYWEVPPDAPPSARRASGVHAMVGPAVAAPSLVDALPNVQNKPNVEAPPPSVRQPALPRFRPRNVGPMFAELEAPGDGRWVALADDALGDPRMFKTLLHPDVERAWAELFVVALDLRRVRLHFVPGTLEPQATVDEAMDLPRPGRVPDE
jgi:hypothetical protein